MEAIQQQMVEEAKKNERANALKEVKRLCKEFGYTAGMLKGSLAEGRKKNDWTSNNKNTYTFGQIYSNNFIDISRPCAPCNVANFRSVLDSHKSTYSNNINTSNNNLCNN